MGCHWDFPFFTVLYFFLMVNGCALVQPVSLLFSRGWSGSQAWGGHWYRAQSPE